VAKHRRLGAVADHAQLRGVVRQTATVVATAITACILVAGLVTVVLAGLDSAKHPAPQAPPPPSGQAADGIGQSEDSPTPAPTQGSNVAYYPNPKRITNSPAAPSFRSANGTWSSAAPGSRPWRVRPEIAGAGRFLDLASHTLDLLDFLLGPIADARGHATNQARLYPAEDIVTGSFAFESGILGTGLWCFTTHHRADEVQIVGDAGRICFSTFGPSDPVRLETEGNAEEFDIPHPPHIQQPMIQAVVNDLNGQSQSPSTGETAARTSRVMDQLLAGWRMGS